MALDIPYRPTKVPAPAMRMILVTRSVFMESDDQLTVRQLHGMKLPHMMRILRQERDIMLICKDHGKILPVETIQFLLGIHPVTPLSS